MLNLPSHAGYAMGWVLSLLGLASIVSYLLQYRHPERDYTELKKRISSWWWMIGILFICLAISTTTALILFAFISFLALKEFFSIVPLRLHDRRVVFLAYLAIPLQYYWVGIGWYGMFIIFIPVYVFLLLPMRMVLIGETKGFIQSAGIIHWASMLTVYCISHVAYLLILPVKNPQAGGVGLVIFILFMTELNDISQYIAGKLFGKHKIIPKVSPNKTWEGFIGGLLTISLLSTLVAPWLTPLNAWQGLGAGVLISCAGFIGDVVISSVKRDLAIKDSGTLIPGHGGILDRLDSLMYTAPLFFHYCYYLAY
ncbi:phosphatidate cytidylyltransferase [Thiothrix eikelboomii]|uniref:Phosphatidate cytidylyltransferase n=1 Tax=Thiothrix eikelboomii TaxID=92487 RepID=A0A1T4WU91_9GAMM|nr:phosphatidate cytidylyltransferase [Thiothrix eikelboomii]SKA80677.1 phosphatidate cytidylyltransferase [Thiothrix eikelboomii]